MVMYSIILYFDRQSLMPLQTSWIIILDGTPKPIFICSGLCPNVKYSNHNCILIIALRRHLPLSVVFLILSFLYLVPLPWQPDVLLVSVPPVTEVENNGLKNKRLIIFSPCHKWILLTIAHLKSHCFMTTAILKIHNRKKDLIWTVWTHFVFDIFRNFAI